MIAKTQPFSLVLGEQHAPTSMIVKGTYNNTFQVNKFFDAFIGTDGSVSNREFWAQFIELKSIPDNAILTVEEQNAKEIIGAVSFKLMTSNVYDSDSNPTTNFEQQINLMLGKIVCTLY